MRLRETKRAACYLTQDEAVRLLDASEGTHLYALIATALFTGMRKSELLNLRWEDVDFEANTITVQSKEDWHTKNYLFRVVEMAAPLRHVLDDEFQRRGSGQQYVFTYLGRKLTSNVTKSLASPVQAAGLTNVTLHTLRHTFASHLAMAGVPLMHIQELLGHKDYQTTLVYAHLSSESHRGQVHRLPFMAAERP